MYEAYQTTETTATVTRQNVREPQRTNYIYRVLFNWLKLSETTRNALLRQGLTDDEIQSFGFRDYPNYWTNLFCSHELAEMFGDLDNVRGFVFDETIGLFRLDLTGRSFGIIAPENDGRRYFTGIRVFPSIHRANYSFSLHSRRASANG